VEEKLNIYQRLLKITEEAEQIPKRGWNDFSKYNYVMAVDVIGHVKKLLVKYGVYASVSELNHQRTSKKEDGKNWHSTIACVGSFFCIDNPTDKHEVSYFSTSADTLDKDIFKAKTNGLKYLFSQQFLIVTDDFIDAENHDVENPANQKPITISNEQHINLVEICESKGVEQKNIDATLQNLAKSFKLKKIMDLPEIWFEDAQNRLDKKL
jgi:hypothetical protein